MKILHETSDGYIRKSVKTDLLEIHQWLMQHKNHFHENFLCNWDLTVKNHDEDKLFVYVEKTSKQIVGYQWGELEFPGILEIRADKRRLGIGRSLVEFFKRRAKDRRIPALKIQCKPKTSIPFWEKMGFSIYDNEYNYAYQLVKLDLPFPEESTPISVGISFFPEERQYSSDVNPLFIFTPSAVRGSDGIIYLRERVCVFTESKEWRGDPVVAITINGEQVCVEKAKYQNAKRMGVKRSFNSVYIDQICQS